MCNGNGVQWNQLIIFNETTIVRHNSIILSTCCMLRVFLPVCNSSIFYTSSTNNVQLMKLAWAQPPPERGRVRPVPSDFLDPGTWHRSAHSRRPPVVGTNSSVFVKMHGFQHKFPFSSGCLELTTGYRKLWLIVICNCCMRGLKTFLFSRAFSLPSSQ